MVTDGKKCYYLALESLSALLREILSKHKEDFYCLNCFNSYTAKNKLKNHYNVCKNHDCCYLEMLNEDNKILKYNNGKMSMKHSLLIYFNLECIFKKMNPRQNDSKKSYTEKKLPYTFWLFLVDTLFIQHNKIRLIFTEIRVV